MIKKKLAIVGVGPRGLYAVENLIQRFSTKDVDIQFHLLLFEETDNFGNGQVYTLNQVSTNWINISERILFLSERPAIQLGEIQIPAYPSYHKWGNKDFKNLPKNVPDTYPPRAKIGEYLKQRFETFINPLLQTEVVSLYKERVENLEMLNNKKIIITTGSNVYEDIDEVLLTIGHQPTGTDKQIAKWEKYFGDNKEAHLFKNPYPIEAFLNCKDLNPKSTVGLRGFGLAMIDAVRGIATKFGKFEIVNEATQQCEFIPSNEGCAKFVPFSLNGLPVVPKPLNAQIDNWYKPTDEQIKDFECIIGDSTIQKKATSPEFLINAIAPIAAKIYSQLPHTLLVKKMPIQSIEIIVIEWLNNDSYQHPLITTQNQTIPSMMHDFVNMASGQTAISLDFCIGQVWRHCQPSIYEQLSYNECNEDVFAEIIHLDENMKRYSYGPPVESIQQMLALVSAGIMTLDFVNNPDIELRPNGWILKSNNKDITADIMINSVLDAPQIKSVNSPIVKNLLSNKLIKSVHDDFGVMTNDNGYLIPQNSGEAVPIALLGRLAKGTIIGVDAILECFGSRIENWADEAADNITN